MTSYTPACKGEVASQRINISIKDSQGNTPLHQIAAKSYPQKTPEEIQKSEEKDTRNIKLILKFNPDVNIKNEKGHTSVHLAITKKRSDALVQVLLDRGAECDYAGIDGEGCNVLYHAVSPLSYNRDSYCSQYSALNFTFRDVSIIKHLIEKGAKVDTVANNGYSPLLLAVVMRKIEYVKMMLEKEAKLLKGSLEKTINTYCCEGYHQSNSYPPKEYYGMTPLQIAVYDDDKEIAQLLVKAGANVNAANGNTSNGSYGRCNQQFDKMTPLMISVYKCNPKMARKLVRAGANVNSVTTKGENSLQMIIKSNAVQEKPNAIEEQTEIAKLLIDRGIGLNAKDESEETVLQLAIKHNKHDIVAHILAKGLAAM